jgi:putative membrane-bound dehydrogenase-like protein
VLVTAAPDIWFFRDTDGDGIADERRVVLTGFGEGNQQLRVNGLTWGRDNWVYGANGRSDGEIRRPGDPPAKAVSIRRRDIRFRPETGEVEAVAGFSQFGLPRDDAGDRFPSWNTIPVRHVVIEERALSRNPYLAESSTVASILDTSDGGRIYSISPTQTRFNRESAAFFNATCGPTIYRGGALGESYEGNAFVCEPLTNLVHRRVLVPSGPTYVARRVEQGREFLASTDPSFRPVDLVTGPDGGLYVVDFYRELVEHPQFVPEDVRKSVEFRRWHDRGRIWRVAAGDGAGRSTQGRPHLGTASARELIALLADPNGWWRDTAQRLLVERQDREAIPLLAAAAREALEPRGRLHALWTLDGLGALDDASLGLALRDSNSRVREGAARLAVNRPGLANALIERAEDLDLRVRFQVAIALGSVHDEQAASALARIAARDAGDEWMRLAVLSSLRESAWPFLKTLLEGNPRWLATPTAEQARLLTQTAAILGARQRPEELRALSSLLTPPPDRGGEPGRIALLAGLAEGLGRAGKPLRGLLASPPSEWREAVRGIGLLLDRAKQVAGSAEGTPEGRAQALQVLARSRPDAAAALISELLASSQPLPVQLAAARALGDVASPDLATQVLDRWGELAIGTRREVLAALLSSAPLAARLLDALEQGAVNPAELDATARDALGRIPGTELHDRAAKILAKSAPPDRSEVLRAYQEALALRGDARRGAELFTKNCQTCHQRQGKGNRVGPDLSGVAGRPASALLSDILDPNHEVSPDFVSFLLVTKAGQVLSGLLVEETAASLKLRRAEGAEETVLLSEVQEFRSSGRSLMPEGLEQSLGMQGVADVLAFLKQP